MRGLLQDERALMILFLQSETLWSILRSPAHWIAEIIVTVLFDGVLLGLCLPGLVKYWRTWKSQQIPVDETMRLSIHCDKPRVHLDTSVDICTGCGDVEVAPSRKSMDTYGVRDDY